MIDSALRQPVTMFGETDEQRYARLRHVELTRYELVRV